MIGFSGETCVRRREGRLLVFCEMFMYLLTRRLHSPLVLLEIIVQDIDKINGIKPVIDTIIKQQNGFVELIWTSFWTN